jgi:hypothetical protein
MTSRPRRVPRALGALLAALLIGGVPAGVLGASGRSSSRAIPEGRIAPAAGAPAGPASAATAAVPFTLDLSTKGDFVAQTNFVQCVGASMQMMLNMIGPADDRTAATQLRLQTLARALSGERPDGRERKGASIRGWTAGLNTLGAGPYRTVGSPDLHSIRRLAASAMRETGRPVGLLVWRGRHAWVMAGFTATADPRLTSDFDVVSVIVLDPLYPYGSKTWGPSPKPGQALEIGALGRQFVPRGTRGGSVPGDGTSGDPGVSWSAGFAGKYTIVLPFVAREPVRLYNARR